MADITTRQVGAANTLEYRLYFGKVNIYMTSPNIKTHHKNTL